MSNNPIDQMIREKRVYFVGERLPTDWYEAFRLWLPLAEAGDAKAQYNIGRCYSNGDGVDKDKNKSLEWLLKAAAQGDPRAHYNIAIWHSEEKDEVQAAEWYAKAAALGEPRALYHQANESFKTGVYSKAKELFKEAYEQGSASAQLGLIACDVSVSIEHSTKENYYSFAAGVSNGNGGGTVTSSYLNPTIVFKVKNKSPEPALVTLWTSTYDFDNPNKKIGDDESFKLPLLQSGQEAQVSEEIHQSKTKKVRIYLIGYSIGDIQFRAYFPLAKEVLAWEWEEPKKSGCFVLTACYESYDAPTVFAFRQFRDNHLQNHWLGKKFITWYYCQGPKMADFISDKPRTKKMLRAVFNRLVKVLPN